MAAAISSHTEPLTLASRVVAAYASNHSMKQQEIGPLLAEVYKCVAAIASGDSIREPAVPVDASITRDYIICLEDGTRLRMLKRYLRTHFNLSPQEYRAKWGLPGNYPMTAPGYSRQRSKFAKEIGLGRTPAPKREKQKGRQTKGARQSARAAAPAESMIAE